MQAFWGGSNEVKTELTSSLFEMFDEPASLLYLYNYIVVAVNGC